VLIQQNVDGSDFFNRSWAEFKAGFNDPKGNFWIGNDLLSYLTVTHPHKLLVTLRINNAWYWAEYSSFTVYSEATDYTLQVSGYSGNCGDALAYHDRMMFTTYDRDNDPWINNCAVYNGGGFWYKSCGSCNINAVRGRGHSFQWKTNSGTLQSSRMWLTC